MWLGLRDFPVLTVQTTKIAAGSGNGKGFCSRFEMKKGLFFNGIYIYAARVPISQTVQCSVHIDLGSADAPVTWCQLTPVRTYTAYRPVVFQLFIKETLVRPFPDFFGCVSSEHFATDINRG